MNPIGTPTELLSIKVLGLGEDFAYRLFEVPGLTNQEIAYFSVLLHHLSGQYAEALLQRVGPDRAYALEEYQRLGLEEFHANMEAIRKKIREAQAPSHEDEREQAQDRYEEPPADCAAEDVEGLQEMDEDLREAMEFFRKHNEDLEDNG